MRGDLKSTCFTDFSPSFFYVYYVKMRTESILCAHYIFSGLFFGGQTVHFFRISVFILRLRGTVSDTTAQIRPGSDDYPDPRSVCPVLFFRFPFLPESVRKTDQLMDFFFIFQPQMAVFQSLTAQQVQFVCEFIHARVLIPADHLTAGSYPR